MVVVLKDLFYLVLTHVAHLFYAKKEFLKILKTEKAPHRPLIKEGALRDTTSIKNNSFNIIIKKIITIYATHKVLGKMYLYAL